MFTAPESAGLPPTLVDQAVIDAAKADAPAAPTGPEAPPGVSSTAPPTGAQNADYEAAAIDLLNTAAAMAAPAFPHLVEVYPPAVREHLALVLAPVLRKYKILLDNLPPEVMLIIAVVPTLPAAVAAYRVDKANNDKAKTYNHEAGTTHANQSNAGAGGNGAGAGAGAQGSAGATKAQAGPTVESPLARFPGLQTKH